MEVCVCGGGSIIEKIVILKVGMYCDYKVKRMNVWRGFIFKCYCSLLGNSISNRERFLLFCY